LIDIICKDYNMIIL